jgi:hypothetical protein
VVPEGQAKRSFDNGERPERLAKGRVIVAA